MAVLAGKLVASRTNCAPLAGKSTLNRLELSRAEPTRYARIAADTGAIEALLVDLFLDAHAKASHLIWIPPMTRCTVIRKAASSTAITTATAICRLTSSADGTCWRRSCGDRPSTPPLVRWKR
jgi:hypothetical protein